MARLPVAEGPDVVSPKPAAKITLEESNLLVERRGKMGSLKLFFICGLLIVFSFSPGLVQAQEKVKIGVCAPLTGALAHTGKDTVMGAEVAAERINVKDIEILRLREGEGGTLRIAVEDEAILARTLELLGAAGLRARRR